MKSAKSFGIPKKLKNLILIRRVTGNSMFPALKNGQLIIASCIKSYNINSIVIIEHDNLQKIKRISKIAEDKVYVIGDNKNESTDSRSFGWIKKSNIKATLFI